MKCATIFHRYQMDTPIATPPSNSQATPVATQTKLPHLDRFDGWLKRRKDLIEFIGICCLIGTLLGQVWYNILMNKSVEASRNSVWVAQQEGIAARIPWLKIDNILSDSLNNPVGSVGYDIYNLSNYPAFFTGEGVKYFHVDSPAPYATCKDGPTIMIPPNGKIRAFSPFDKDSLNGAINDFMEQKMEMQIAIQYEDISGHKITMRLTIKEKDDKSGVQTVNTTIDKLEFLAPAPLSKP